MTTLTATKPRDVARPLKILVPLIQQEIRAGESAGLEHYARAGELLIEAKAQMPYGNWGRWIPKNFKGADGTPLSQKTAQRYMRLAEIMRRRPELATGPVQGYDVLLEGPRERPRAHASWRPVLKAAKDLDAELFAQERQTRADEIQLHRNLAVELIDLGYRALATRLHPDRGGSNDAMKRLHVVRDVLKQVAQTRGFV